MKRLIGRPREALLCAKAKRQQQSFICAKAKRQQQSFICAKAKRQQQSFICAKAKRQQQSAQPERKSTSRYGEGTKIYESFHMRFSNFDAKRHH
ncbi:hypothetical protein ACQKOF_21075 [Lysinibacillus sp. NPDC093190]|uniref:hypothetical protein n=1 Tax=Lysinibacillus sp. NPDC093190 TaxID=3390575 RepID=UPI003D0665BC